jgi:hypothetical protein
MTRFACLLALLIGLLAFPVAAQPTDPVGEFRGVMHVRKYTYDVGMKVRRTPEGYAATFDWITLELRDIPLNRVASGGLVFERKAPQGVLVARFDPATGWRAEWHRWGEVFPTTLHRAALPPAPLLPRHDRNALILLGVLILAQGAGIARLLQLRRRRRRRRAQAGL